MLLFGVVGVVRADILIVQFDLVQQAGPVGRKGSGEGEEAEMTDGPGRRHRLARAIRMDPF